MARNLHGEGPDGAPPGIMQFGPIKYFKNKEINIHTIGNFKALFNKINEIDWISYNKGGPIILVPWERSL